LELVLVRLGAIGRIAPCFVELCEAVASERVSTAERFEGAKSVKRPCAGSLKATSPRPTRWFPGHSGLRSSLARGRRNECSRGLLLTCSLPDQRAKMPLIARIRRRRGMTFLARTRRHLQKMSPYLSLVLLLVPLLLVEPLKLVAVFIAGKGHWLTGTGMLVGAYAVSLLFVERLFRVVKPKLMMLDWFARLWMWFVTVWNKVVPWPSKIPSAQPRA
jgi:hypothetical protein